MLRTTLMNDTICYMSVCYRHVEAHGQHVYDARAEANSDVVVEYNAIHHTLA